MENKQINKLRSYIGSLRPSNGKLALVYLGNLASMFGKLEMNVAPFEFSLYYDENGDLIFERAKGKIKDIVDENHSMSILDVIKLYKDDIIVEEK